MHKECVIVFTKDIFIDDVSIYDISELLYIPIYKGTFDECANHLRTIARDLMNLIISTDRKECTSTLLLNELTNLIDFSMEDSTRIYKASYQLIDVESFKNGCFLPCI